MPQITNPSTRPVVFTDLDGTLVVGCQFHPTTKEAVGELSSKGIQVIPVTGRGPDLSEPVLSAIGIPVYPGGYHHGAITYAPDKTVLINKTCDMELIHSLWEAREAVLSATKEWCLDAVLIGQGLNHRFLFNDTTKRGQDMLVHLGSPVECITHVQSPLEIPTEDIPELYQVSFCNFTEDESRQQELCQLVFKTVTERLAAHGLDGKYKIFISGNHFVDILRTDVDKSHSIKALSKHMGFRVEDVVALGDAQNDLGMLRLAGTSIAMPDGMAEVRAMAGSVSPQSTLKGGWRSGVEFLLN